MPTSPLGLLAFAFVLGMRHALDVDHLAAVSTIVSRRAGLWRSTLVGAVWGLGHTAALLATAVVVVALHTEIPPAVERGLELGVALMLIGLGANLLRTLRAGGAVHLHAHTHGEHLHVHPHVHASGAAQAHDHVPVGRRPFLVGCMHGLAGSAALMLAVAATIPDPVWALGYVAVFGLGSVGGMVLMSALLGLPLALAARRFAHVEIAVRATAAVASVAIGLALAWEIGLDAGLFV